MTDINATTTATTSEVTVPTTETIKPAPVITHSTPARGVPIPVSKKGRQAKPYEDTFGFDTMQVGELLVFNAGSKDGVNKVRNAASVHKKHTNGVWNFTSRDLSGTSVHGKVNEKHPDYTVGIWRTPEVVMVDDQPDQGPKPILEVTTQASQ